MQTPMYYTPTSKSAYQNYTPPSKNDHHPVGTHHTSFVANSPRSNFDIHKIDERPLSHNISLNANSNKNIGYGPHNEVKPYKVQNMFKPTRLNSINEKPNGQQPYNRYGQMKSSYMGPDSRQTAYVKEHKQSIGDNPSPRIIKKVPRISQNNIFNQVQSSIINQRNDDNNFQNTLNKRKNEQMSGKSSMITMSTINSNGLEKVPTIKKLDHEQRFLMRKSSIEPTQNWIKSLPKKKAQKKFCLMDFQKLKQLGTGKYGKVFLVKQKQTEFICALKIIEKQMLKQEQITQQFIRQLKIQLFLNHPNIIKMYGYFDDSINIYIIMEVALGGQLYKQLKRGTPMPEPKIAIIMRQVVSAVNELHSNQIIHRDIKPQNIVLNQNIVKLCDFGWSVYHGQTLRSTFCGTPLYVSPQILKGNNYDQKIDIWSLGIMMYQMLTGENPFKITQQQQLIKIIKQSVSFPSYSTVSAQAKDFVFSCLKKNPNERVNIRQLINHQFFKKYPEKSPDKKTI